MSVLAGSAPYCFFDLGLGVWPSCIYSSAKTLCFSYITTNNVHFATQCGVP